MIKPWRKRRRKLLTLRKNKKHKSWSRDGLGGEKTNIWCCLKNRGRDSGEPQREMEQAVFVETAENALEVVTERSFYIFSSIFQWNIEVKTRLQWVERANMM